MHSKITILGGGLTGLTLAYLLEREGMDFQILEARNRLGGRLFTKMSGNHIPVDLGAAWFWDYNPRLQQLLKDLKIASFPQKMGPAVWYQQHSSAGFQQMQLPEQQQTSYRIHGGSTNLILSLAATLEKERIHLDTVVDQIRFQDHTYSIHSNLGVVTTDNIVCTIPPAVMAHSLDFQPQLPADFLNIATATQTWMEDSIKFGLGFPTAFWKEQKIPVTAFSNSGSFTELYDYSNFEQDRFAIMGFLHPQMNHLTAENRKTKVVDQLVQLFGPAVNDYVSYEECAWNAEPFTNATPKQSLAPHQNNGHPILRSHFNNRSLIMAGSETSAVLAGYMEGALHSAHTAFDILMSKS